MATGPAGNCARFAGAPLSRGGTPVAAWLTALREKPLPPIDLADCPALVVAAPHPDDETLGLGAMAAQLAAARVDVQVVSVSDGGAAAPSKAGHLEQLRRAELQQAAAVLGIRAPISLALPDGELADHEEALADSLASVLGAAAPGSWCAATWRGDGHPDHEAVGRAAAAACARTGAVLLEYPVWMWHWATPGDPAVPWSRAYSVPASAWARDRKHRAAQCFRSQLMPYDGAAAVVPPDALRRLLAVGEVVFR